jgi:hypothetical protein
MKMIVRDRVPAAPSPPPATVDRDTIYALVFLILIYTPGIAVLIFAASFRKRPDIVSERTI